MNIICEEWYSFQCLDVKYNCRIYMNNSAHIRISMGKTIDKQLLRI